MSEYDLEYGAGDTQPSESEQAQTQEQLATQKPAKGKVDVISQTAKEVENLTKSKARNLADSLANNIEENYFRLGGVLKVISENGWFDGYDSFDTYVYERFGFQKRKADYLKSIYVNLVDKQIPWDKVAHLGWTKLKDLAPILTLDNVDAWVAKAASLTVLELQAALKAKGESAGGEVATTDDIVKMKFPFKQDQAETVQHALAKAKGELQTEYDTVALENICAGYLAGNSGLQYSSDIKQMCKEVGWEAWLTVFAEIYPQIDIEVKVPENT